MNKLMIAGGALLALFGAAEAASNLNSSKSNIYKPIATEADKNTCLNAGGVVVILDGSLMCQVPAKDETKKAG